MSTIFPLSASVNQEFDGYRFDGTRWNIIGVDLTADYPEISDGYISASVIPLEIARVDYVDTEIANIDALPLQTGNEGKFLTTSGSSAYWETVDALPSQAGNSGKFLTTDGDDASWATVDLTSAINTASAAAVTYLVDYAPSTLDTLNELAAALGDDENFATTVTNSLSNKLDISSASTTYATIDSPNLITPNIGEASGTSLETTGNVVYHLKILTPTITSNSYTLNGSEDGCMLMIDNSTTDATLYVPTDATYNFAIGTQITIVQKGDSQTTITATTPETTTLHYTPGNKTRAQYSAATLIKTAANQWMLMGDLTL